MVTKVFDRQDTELYCTWHLEEGGVVCLVVPELGEVRMTLAKAEEIAASIKRNAAYGRLAASDKVNLSSEQRKVWDDLRKSL